jgi:release factor glutamine methyltransferase
MPGWTPPQRTLRDVMVDAERRLAGAGVTTPRVDAELLLSHTLGIPRGRLFLSDPIDPADQVRFETLIARRASRVPLQHLVGEAPFRHLTLEVGPGVFIPRPETETVAEYAIQALRDTAQERCAVDLCTGSGAIALAIATEVPGSIVHAVEREEAAYTWARRNVDRLHDSVVSVNSQVVLHHADATTVHEHLLANLNGRVDVVVSNPPYIPSQAVPRDPEVREFDPPAALYAGADGLDVVRGLALVAMSLLRSGGRLVVEHSDQQGDSAGEQGVPHVLRTAGFEMVEDHVDLTGRDRLTTAVRP